MLNNPFYYGEFEWPINSGNWYKGVHQQMITKKEFDQVQAMLGKTGRARPIKHSFAYGGCILHCGECGCAITGYEKTKLQKNGNCHNYTYYGCSKRKCACSQKPVREEDLRKDIEKTLSDIQVPEVIHDFFMQWIKAEKLFTFAELAIIRFKDGDDVVKRGIVTSLGWNLLVKDKKLDFSREKWLEPLKEIAKVLQEELPRLEPLLAVKNKDKIEKLLKSSILCTRLYDVRTCVLNMPGKKRDDIFVLPAER